MSRDQAQRVRALDVSRSFIVQAPAGSGKTELLIQRYLALLARVELPEQIVAITFTRKAAAEMRRRVLEALSRAADGPVPAEAHHAKTHALATDALERARARDWDIELQPHRLRIETLDAMNAWLARRLSVLAGGVAGADLAADARHPYGIAVRRALESLDGRDALATALQTLLRALDNNAAQLEQMLLELLPRRDQWLPYLVGGTDETLRELLEKALARLVEESLTELDQRLGTDVRAELAEILRHVAAHATDSAMAGHIAAWRSPETALEPVGAMLEAWRALPELLLTQKGDWRKTLFAKHGFGKDHAAMSDRLRSLIATLEDDETLRAALHAIRRLPDAEYGDHDWHLLAALRQVLVHLAAELKVVFGERRIVDFIELALGAQDALGGVEDPSELLLALDRRIQHVLVDEFQDTSHTQLRLLGLLTGGWQPGDGRTLFLVGDPMQSIYRFRQADMSLFLRTKSRGIGAISCEALLLESNFRSAPAVVDWVNDTFAELFGSEDDIGTGAARFHACRATRHDQPGQSVRCHALRSDDPGAEIERVVEILEAERRARPDGSVAVLVRSRTHLVGLEAQLAASGLSVHAVELEAPNQRQIVQDLLGLTRAMTHLGDRLAWLAVLRAPWCGLAWNDLESLAAGNANAAIWDCMRDEDRLADLSEDTRQRLLRTRAVLAHAFEGRATAPFERWIELTWRRLGGPACLDTPQDVVLAEGFFATLAEIGTRGDVDDPAALEEHFVLPHGRGEAPRESGIEIMTIHRAKGLEFDTVVLLGLGRKPPPEQRKALYWLERTADDGSEDLLLAPMSTPEMGRNGLAEFIKQADAERDRAEAKRLLYVATTRARERLHLIARLDARSRGPAARSLLEYLWPRFEPLFAEARPPTAPPSPAVPSLVPKLRRVARPAMPELDPVGLEEAGMRPEFIWASPAAARVGTVVHAALHEIGRAPPTAWSTQAIRDRRARYARELAMLGVDEDELEPSATRVVEALCAVLDDDRGRWLLKPRQEAASELPLTIAGERGLEHIRIDRTFVDEDDLRWIVDFKTSTHEGGDLEAFLDSETERYERQLARYADAMRKIDDRPIRLGLYFPLLQAFRHWPAREHAPRR